MPVLRRREVAWAMVAAWLAVAVWRFLVAVATDDDRYGEAQRAHAPLLLLQAVLAALAAATWGAVTVSAHDRRSRDVAGSLALFALFVAAFAAIFLRHGLLDWGAYEN
jgi:hypothetical protein